MVDGIKRVPAPTKTDSDHAEKHGIADKAKGTIKTAVDTMTEAAHMRDTMKGPPGPEDD